MPSEIELRDAIEDLAAEASDTSALLHQILHSTAASSPARSTTLARRLLPAGAAALVVALAVTLVVISAGPHRTSTPSTGPAPGNAAQPCTTSTTPNFTGIDIAAVPDLNTTIKDEQACSGYRVRSLYTTSGGLVGYLTIFRPGTFDTDLVKNARKVNGSGITGYVVTLPADGTGEACRQATAAASTNTKLACSRAAGLAWQYQPSVWATITSTATGGTVSQQFFGSDPVTKELSVASAVRTTTRPLRTPFRLSTLAGLKPYLAGATTQNDHTNDYGASAANLQLAAPGRGINCPTRAACAPAVSIQVQSSISNTFPADNFPGSPISIDHTTGKVLPHGLNNTGPQVRFLVNHWAVIITSTDTTTPIPAATLITLAKAMTFADSTQDTSSWFTFNQALPR